VQAGGDVQQQTVRWYNPVAHASEQLVWRRGSHTGEQQQLERQAWGSVDQAEYTRAWTLTIRSIAPKHVEPAVGRREAVTSPGGWRRAADDASEVCPRHVGGVQLEQVVDTNPCSTREGCLSGGRSATEIGARMADKKGLG
jgi:hypothetical protein